MTRLRRQVDLVVLGEALAKASTPWSRINMRASSIFASMSKKYQNLERRGTGSPVCHRETLAAKYTDRKIQDATQVDGALANTRLRKKRFHRACEWARCSIDASIGNRPTSRLMNRPSAAWRSGYACRPTNLCREGCDPRNPPRRSRFHLEQAPRTRPSTVFDARGSRPPKAQEDRGIVTAMTNPAIAKNHLALQPPPVTCSGKPEASRLFRSPEQARYIRPHRVLKSSLWRVGNCPAPLKLIGLMLEGALRHFGPEAFGDLHGSVRRK